MKSASHIQLTNNCDPPSSLIEHSFNIAEFLPALPCCTIGYALSKNLKPLPDTGFFHFIIEPDSYLF